MNATALTNRVLAALLALLLLLGGLLGAAEIVLAALNRPPLLIPRQQWSTWLGQQSWNTPVVRIVLAAMALIGVLLIRTALRRGKPPVLAAPNRVPGVRVSMPRRSVEKTVAAAARNTSGVQGASAAAGRRAITVTVRTPMRSPGNLRSEALTAVTGRLRELDLADTLRAKVKVVRTERSR